MVGSKKSDIYHVRQRCGYEGSMVDRVKISHTHQKNCRKELKNDKTTIKTQLMENILKSQSYIITSSPSSSRPQITTK